MLYAWLVLMMIQLCPLCVRRQEIFDLYISRCKQKDIAVKVNCSLSTVERVIRSIRERELKYHNHMMNSRLYYV